MGIKSTGGLLVISSYEPITLTFVPQCHIAHGLQVDFIQGCSVIVIVLRIRVSQWSITTNLWSLTTHNYYVMIIVTVGFSNKSFVC